MRYTAFRECSELTSVTFFKYYSDNPFVGCTKIKEFHSKITNPSHIALLQDLGNGISFLGLSPSNITLYIPKGTYKKYEEQHWTDLGFKEIIEE